MSYNRPIYFRAAVPITIILGLAFSAFIARQAERSAAATDQVRFDRFGENLKSEIVRSVRQFEYGLRGAKTLWSASQSVERAEFSAMVRSWDLHNEFPGALGIGFIRRVSRGDLPAFLENTRKDAAPGFKLKTSGDHPDHYITEHIEPLAENLASQGFDIGQEPNRRNAAEQAMLTGGVALTKPITLIQAKDEGPGFLVLLALYKNGLLPANPEQRRADLVGWTCMPITASRILASVCFDVGGEIDFEVFQGDSMLPSDLLFDDDDHLKSPVGAVNAGHYGRRSFHAFSPLFICGQRWTVAYSANNRFQKSSRVGVYSAAIGGPVFTFLLSGLLLSLSRTTRKAEDLAAAMTANLSAAMRESEMLVLVATRTTNAVIITDTNRKITWINEGFTRLTGYTHEEALGKSPGGLVQHPLANPETIASMREALDRREHFKGEILNRSKTGRDYWVDLDIVPLRNEDGVFTGFMAVELETTERKEAEARLKEQADRTELALEAGNLGLWDWHIPSGDRFVFDQRWAVMLGEDGSNQCPYLEDWSSRCHPEDLPRIHAAIDSHFAEETPIYRCRHRMKHRLGNWLWINACGKLISRSADGKPLRMVGTYEDITAQYLAQLELERRTIALHHTSRLANVGSWELDVSGQILTWSDQVRLIHEVGPDYVPDVATAVAFYEGEAAVAITQAVSAAIEHGISYDLELPLVTAKGNTIWVRSMGEVQRHDDKTLILRGALQDITESYNQRQALAQAKDAAEAASRAKAGFLANMSHEIRTPMNAVIGMTEMLQTTSLDAVQTEFVSTIKTSSDALLKLINDILDFSKIESGHLDLEQTPVNLRDCVESALDLSAHAAATKMLDLLIWIEPDVPPAILGDITRLRQIITNLFTNAVKFTEIGEVLLSITRQPGQQLRFTVSDTGIGIPADRLDRLFKSFSQVDASTTRHYGGTGLGLAICDRLVRLMGGRIWVESIPGQGSSFCFEIPCEAATTDDLPHHGKHEPILFGRRLLIVDDNATSRRILSLQAKNWGMHAHTAASGAEALALMDDGSPFDAAIIDDQMPGMDGFTLAGEIRLRLPALHLPIIALTSVGARAKVFSTIDLTQIVTKPAKSSVLHDALVNLFQPRVNPALVTIPSSPLPLLGQIQPFRILLAEDIPINQRIALLLFERLGYTADVANNGLEVLDAVAKERFDIIFLDVQMPEMDGLTCAKQLCVDYPATSRPWIIAMTANALNGDREKCLAAGMDDYLSKPISGQAIADALLRAAAQLDGRAGISASKTR